MKTTRWRGAGGDDKEVIGVIYIAAKSSHMEKYVKCIEREGKVGSLR
jgi:hypothetical protein